MAWRMPEILKKCSFLWNATITVYVQIYPRFCYLNVQNSHRLVAAKCPENCVDWSCSKFGMNRILCVVAVMSQV